MANDKALTNRVADFWLLGGASLLVWLVMFVGSLFRDQSWAVSHHLQNSYALFNTLALLVNYPHFLASYKLAYGGGSRFVKRNWFQLMAVPMALFLFMGYGVWHFSTPSKELRFTDTMNSVFSFFGIETLIGVNPNIGTEYINILINIMYLTVGWHYTKQIYGCMMVYARFDGYTLSNLQRRLIRWNLYGIWFLSFVTNNIGFEYRTYFEADYYTLNIPSSWKELSWVYLLITLGLVCYFVFLKNKKEKRQWPSANMLVPFVAMYVWWLPLFHQTEYYRNAVPFFHCLQYLVFIERVEWFHSSQMERSRQVSYRTLVVLGLIIAGFLFFEFIPSLLDTKFDTINTYGFWVYFVLFGIFLNIHHYFIDNVLWKLDDAKLKAALFQ
ncbi:MAG: hypothetical protein RJB66_1537 [Pseudomonadota bacterium]